MSIAKSLLLLSAAVITAWAADVSLAPLSATLQPMRKQELSSCATSRCAGPQTTVAKHQLRDWIQSRLPKNDDGRPIAWELNQQLKSGGLTCEPNFEHPTCDWGSAVGYVGPVKIEHQADHLIVQTQIGIICGFDDSAYIYQWQKDHRVRRWQRENNDYREKNYVPEQLEAVLLGPTFKNPHPLVLTLATYPWCSSRFSSAIYALWRLGPDETSTKLLLYNREDADRTAHFPPVTGSVGKDDAMIEFSSFSLDCQMLAPMTHAAIRHYQVDGDRVTRIGPLAVSPLDFVEEWLNAPWPEGTAWSERDLRKWHQPAQICSGTFQRPIMHCPKQPDTWQIALDREHSPTTYFLIRWRPPYEFTMVDISGQPWPGCTEPDRMDLPYPAGTLFPIQEWRR